MGSCFNQKTKSVDNVYIGRMWWTWIVSCFFFLLHVQAYERKGFGPGEQDWNLTQVRPDVYMFWWLYYANPPSRPTDFNAFDRPLIIWLAGGPGGSSTGRDNFSGIGPVDVYGHSRNFTWVNDYNVLFIDNPAGAGFSRVGPDGTFPKNNFEVSQDLITCIRAFLSQNPDFKAVPTYLVGSSYGGKMAIELAYHWNKLQKQRRIESNFRGVALGSPWISPIDSVLSWAPFLYENGFLDASGRDAVAAIARRTKSAASGGLWRKATNLYSTIWREIEKYVGGINAYNILQKIRLNDTSQGLGDEELNEFMNVNIARMLGLPPTFGVQADEVFPALYDDYMKPTTDYVKRLRDETNVKIVVYTGTLDLVVATPGTVAWVDKVYQGDIGWRRAIRTPVVINHIIEGYAKQYKNFKLYWILRSGHSVPYTNPAIMCEILKYFTAS